MEMNVGRLKEIIKDLPDDMLVFVGCEGYCNYDFEPDHHSVDENLTGTKPYD